jgi:hypothetical protein
MNVKSSGTFAKKYYCEVLNSPASTPEAKDAAAAQLVGLEKLQSDGRRNRQVKRLERQLATALARIKELEATPVPSPILNSLRDLVAQQ